MRILLLLGVTVLLIVPLVVGESSFSTSPQVSPTVQTSSSSWNPATSCNAVVLSIEQFIGTVPNPTQKAPSQGADYSGGSLILEGVKPAGTNPASTSWPYSKRSTSPPCTVTLSNGTVLPTLVEIHGVKVGFVSNDECGSVFANTCDETFNTCNTFLAPNCNSSYPDTMHKVHNEIDMYWIHNGISPPIPTPGSIIDVQGFVFWDDQHLSDNWHSFSGWEVHPLTAWRMSGSSQSDFSISSSPSSVTVSQGSSTTSAITLSSINSFAGTVTLSASVSPNGPIVSLNPTSASLASGTSASSTLSVSVANTVPLGSYSVQVTGSSGSLVHSTTISASVTSSGPPPDFTISSSPSSVTVTQGSSATSTITLSSINSFTGTVALSASVSPNGPIVSVNPTGVTLASGTTAISTLSVSAPNTVLAGSYSVQVTGSDGSLVHSTTVSVTVTSSGPPPDFSISANPSSLSLPTSGSGNSTITLTSLNGFSGTISLSASSTAPHVRENIAPSVTLISGSSNTVILTVTAGHKARPGIYSITVTAVSGTLTHQVTIGLTIL